MDNQLEKKTEIIFNNFYHYYNKSIDSKNNKDIIHAKVYELISRASTVIGEKSCAKIHSMIDDIYERIINSNKLKFLCCMNNELDALLVDSREEILRASGLDRKKVQMCQTSNVLLHSLNAFISADSLREFVQSIDDSMEQHTDVIVALALLMTISFAVWLLARRAKESVEFRFLAEFNERNWARKLIETDVPFRKFRIEDAWHKASLTDFEISEAVSALDGKFGFFTLSANQGDKYDSAFMQDIEAKRKYFVFAQLHPGLKLNQRVLEKALVDTGTEEYVALKKLRDHRLTSILLEQVDCSPDDLASTYTLEKLDLIELMGRASVQELDDWLKQIVSAVPSGELELIDVKVGSNYREREMLNANSDNTPVLARARVKSIQHVGLKRNGYVLFEALVTAVDCDGNEDQYDKK